jgi:hypothetical protein
VSTAAEFLTPWRRRRHQGLRTKTARSLAHEPTRRRAEAVNRPASIRKPDTARQQAGNRAGRCRYDADMPQTGRSGVR